ncbi:MAG: O-antigen ligase family protein [Gammaproteobacteria bacterium]
MIAQPAVRAPRYRSDRSSAIAGIIGLIVVAGLFGAAVPVLGFIVPLAIIMLGFMVWVLLDFRAGVAFSIVLMPLSPLSFFPHEMLGVRGLNPLNVIILMTMISYVVHAGLRRWRDPLIPARLLFWYLTPIIIAGLIGTQYVSLIPPHYEAERLLQFHDSIGYLRDLLIKPQFLVMLALMVALAVRHSKKPERFVYLMLVSSWVFCALVGWLLATSGMSLRQLASPLARTFLGQLGMHANEMSLLLNTMYAMTLFSIRDQTHGALRNVLFVSSLMLAFCVLMTFSRGGFLGLLLINVIYFWKRISIKTVVIFLLVGATLGPFVFDAVMERALTGVDVGDRGAVTAGRLDGIWLPLLPYVLEEPVLPHGLFSILWSPPIRLNRMLPVAQTHSAWLGGLMDLGLVGFGFVLAFLLFVRREFIRLSREHASPLLQGLFAGGAVCIPVWFIQGVTDDHFTPWFSQSFLWIAIGILMGCGGLYRARKKKIYTAGLPARRHDVMKGELAT